VTEAQIRTRIKELAGLQKDADTGHLTVMLEVGKLINEVKILKDYSDWNSAESDVGMMLKGAGHPRCGEQYIRACRQFAFKMSDTQRKVVGKFQLGVEDVKALTNMHPDKIAHFLQEIRKGKLKPAYGTGGITYHLMSVANPSKRGKRRDFIKQLNIDAARDPAMIQARVFHRGEIQDEALEDLFSSVYSRVPYDRAEKARMAGLRRAGVDERKSA